MTTHAGDQELDVLLRDGSTVHLRLWSPTTTRHADRPTEEEEPTMRVLVTAATKYGATAEIAAAIAEVLDEHGLEATVLPPEQVNGVDGYDAVVVGSAVYAGHWLKPARELVEQHGGALASRPVWLFSSGPVGDPPKPEEDPVDVADLLTATAAREHRGVRRQAGPQAAQLP
jgi:menaquinone-dependent protoporphyrinogen oxidase